MVQILVVSMWSPSFLVGLHNVTILFYFGFNVLNNIVYTLCLGLCQCLPSPICKCITLKQMMKICTICLETCKVCLSFWRLEKHETSIYGVILVGGIWQGKLHGLRGFSCNATCYSGISFHFKLSCHEVTIFDNQS
jgi:hypothetical protein